MAFPVTARTTGTLITATIWNSDLKDNLNALYGGAQSVTSQAAEGVNVTSSATALRHLAKGNALEVLRVNEAGTALEFGEGAKQPFKDAVIVGRSRFGGLFN